MVIRDIFNGLKMEYSRISVRIHTPNGVDYLGGGYSPTIIKRYGDKTVIGAEIMDNILVVFVEP